VTRRDLIALLGSTAAMWPVAARAQQTERMRRIGVILATGVSTVGPLQQVTSAVPIVFAVVPDPVGAGIVDCLARPGGNVTGFSTFEYGPQWKMAGTTERGCASCDPSGGSS
jgi:ABC transporter substrate binding protein